MRIQVLAIGAIESGKGQSGNEYNRRTFQVFDPASQVAGNIPVYADKPTLESYSSIGLYDAEFRIQAGNRGALEVRIVNLKAVPTKPN